MIPCAIRGHQWPTFGNVSMLNRWVEWRCERCPKVIHGPLFGRHADTYPAPDRRGRFRGRDMSHCQSEYEWIAEVKI